jgi:hypothetical protein
VVHIESRKSLRKNSEFEIFVDLESEKGNVYMPDLVKSLKRQISYIKIDGEHGSRTQSITDEIKSLDEHKSVKQSSYSISTIESDPFNNIVPKSNFDSSLYLNMKLL